MTFEKVTADKLGEIYALFQAAVADMRARGLMQWEWGRYPTEEILNEDVQLGRLYRVYDGGQPVGAFAVCVGQGPEYDDIGWQYGVAPVCLHRLAIDPKATGHGYARAAVAFARQEGLRLGCDCFRVDTYEHNLRALRLFRSATVREAGTFRFPGYTSDFHCFEAPLTADCPLLPMHMNPAYRHGDATPWGGDALTTLYGRAIPDERTGEALEVSCIPGLESRTDADETLPALIARSGEGLTGVGHTEPFPLLLKLLNAKSKLSVQVHPNDEYALAHEHKLGKTEAWVILHAEEGATLYYGLKDGVTRQALADALLSGGDVEPMLAAIPVTTGDVLYMPSGMVHAICGGITLYEIQQSSDVTYRLWDYHRKDAQGRERELHIWQSLDVVDPALRGQRARLPGAEQPGLHPVLSVPAFTLDCLCVTGEAALAPHPQSFRILTALNALTLRWLCGRLALRPGDSALLPASCPALTVEGIGRALVAGV